MVEDWHDRDDGKRRKRHNMIDSETGCGSEYKCMDFGMGLVVIDTHV